MEAFCLGLSASSSAPTGKGKDEQSGKISPSLRGKDLVFHTACCPVDLKQKLPLSYPKTDRFWGLFYLSPTLQWQEDPKLVQSFKISEMRGLHIYHPKRDEKMTVAYILFQHALYLKLKACMNKDFCTGEI